MEFAISFDLRAPSFGSPARELYAAALDQCAWADELGFDVIGIAEHHATEDGYLPSPLLFAAAAAARTRRIALRPSVLLAPLYDPVKLAEDSAIVQILSGGRLRLGLGSGYRPAEFAMFGTRREDRKARTLRVIALLRKAWTGEAFEWEGRRVRVTPAPDPPPPILLGGSHPAVARRAAHVADGYFPPQGESWEIYRAECLAIGKPDPGEGLHLGPVFVHVTRDPEAAWQRLRPHVEHVTASYAAWTREAYGRAAGPFAKGVSLDDVKRSGAYRVVTPAQAIALADELGPNGVYHFTPLLGGLDPEFAWQSLRLFEREVWPEIRPEPDRAREPGRRARE
jgi:alkanesulfonate monooxygenase SsuD/methylene tetrahydromethanopterin reductase-like flavin-dependent oxidoreductase (luciferase family)